MQFAQILLGCGVWGLGPRKAALGVEGSELQEFWALGFSDVSGFGLNGLESFRGEED